MKKRAAKALRSPPSPWLTVDEACSRARVSRITLWRYGRSGKFPIHRFGGRRLVDKDELDHWIRSGNLAAGEYGAERQGRRRQKRS